MLGVFDIQCSFLGGLNSRQKRNSNKKGKVCEQIFSNNTHAGEWMQSDRETSNNAAIVHEKAKT